MDEVAAASRVSKQTVYKHFGSKETLFIEVVGSMTTATGDGVYDPVPDSDALPVENLTRYLEDYASNQLRKVLNPDVLQLRRLVIGESGRFPNLGRELHERGPMRAIRNLTALFTALRERGLLDIEEPTRAAAEFNWLVMGEPLNRAMLLGDSGIPDDEELRTHIASVVHSFLAAHHTDSATTIDA